MSQKEEGGPSGRLLPFYYYAAKGGSLPAPPAPL